MLLGEYLELAQKSGRKRKERRKKISESILKTLSEFFFLMQCVNNFNFDKQPLEVSCVFNVTKLFLSSITFYAFFVFFF